MNARLEFGVPKNVEMAKDNTEQKRETELLLKLANTGKVFADIMANSKSEDDFIEACKEIYNKYKSAQKQAKDEVQEQDNKKVEDNGNENN